MARYVNYFLLLICIWNYGTIYAKVLQSVKIFKIGRWVEIWKYLF
jgi:hypothetical protein